MKRRTNERGKVGKKRKKRRRRSGERQKGNRGEEEIEGKEARRVEGGRG
jgi:hypothetical protein